MEGSSTVSAEVGAGTASSSLSELAAAITGWVGGHRWETLSALLAVALAGVSLALALKKQKCAPLALLTGGKWATVPWVPHPEDLAPIEVHPISARHVGAEARTVAAKVACNENENCVAFTAPVGSNTITYYARRDDSGGQRRSVAFQNIEDQGGAKVHVHMGRVGGITCKDFGLATCNRSF